MWISILCLFLVGRPSQGYKHDLSMVIDGTYLDVHDDSEENSSKGANRSQENKSSKARLYQNGWNPKQCDIFSTNPKGCCQPQWQCGIRQIKDAWLDLGFINDGTYGEVYHVSNGNQHAAWKRPKASKGNHGCLDIRREIDKLAKVTEAMSKIQGTYPQCPSTIMSLIDRRPCIINSKNQMHAQGASYVMDFMDGDLFQFSVKFPPECHNVIARKTFLAIRCFHRAGWVHSDIKLQNFLWRGRDHQNCPKEVRLADYGLSGRIGSVSNTFPDYHRENENGTITYYAWYLVSDMFKRPLRFRDDRRVWKLNLQLPKDKSGVQKYKIEPKIDWCSFHFFFPHLRNKYWWGDCGMMGPGRNQRVIVIRDDVSNGFDHFDLMLADQHMKRML